MENIIEIYKAQLLIEEERLLEISEKIAPLEKEKTWAEQNIKALKQLIGSKEEINKDIIQEKTIKSLNNKTPAEAYEI
jgi:hypothetical protein